MLTDPISDMLTRIRNAGHARLTRVSMPSSRMKRELARVLKQEGFIRDFAITGDETKPVLTVDVQYARQNQPMIEGLERGRQNQPMIEGLERISKPSRRVYVGAKEIPRVRNGLGVAILSTPRGILTDKQARDARVGGEVLARVW
jgi:small subunit ribosomal protein S8